MRSLSVNFLTTLSMVLEKMNDQRLIEDFIAEAEEILEGLDQDLVALESNPQDQRLLEKVFRAVHTIKGNAGFLGYNQLVELTHKIEDLLNLLRAGERELNPEIIDVLLESIDFVKRIIGQIKTEGLDEVALSDVLRRLDGAFVKKN